MNDPIENISWSILSLINCSSLNIVLSLTDFTDEHSENLHQ